MRAVRYFFLALWFIVSISFAGQMEYKSKNMTVVIQDNKCENFLFMFVLAQVGEEVGIAEITMNDGRRIEACWTMAEEKIILMDADGDTGYILLSDFKAAPGI